MGERTMKSVFRHIGVSLLIVLLLTGLFVGMGTLTAMIPQSAIAENIRASSDRLPAGEIRDYLVEGEHSTLIDLYADAVLLNIAWHSDAETPLKSYLEANYLKGSNDYQTQMLRDSAYHGAEADASYSRYWHGMLVLVRPLLMVTDIIGIRVINAAALVLLGAALIALLVRRRLFALIWGYAVALLVCYCFIVPLCMEYMAPFVLFHLFSILILLWDEKLESTMPYLFLVFGALTCYFDFLTTETLVFVVPMVVILCLRGRDGRMTTFKTAFWTTVSYGIHWLCGYLVFYPIKWVLTSLVQGESTIGASVTQALVHMKDARVEGVMWLDGIVSNIGRLFPFTLLSNGITILMTAILLAAVLVIAWFYFRRRKIDGYAYLLPLVCLLPYLRYSVLTSHAVVHGFMDFRAQLGSILALFGFYALTTSWKEEKRPAGLPHKKGRRR